MNFKIFWSLPKSLYINCRLFPFKTAIKMPILVSNRTKCHIEKGCNVIINSDEIKAGMIKVGFGGSDTISANRSILKLYSGCRLSFRGGATFAEGISIVVKGELKIGNHFYCNRNCSISCDNKIVFGDNCLLAYHVELRDGDGHFMGTTENGTTVWLANTAEITIGEDVWISAKASIVKGAIIQSHSVVGYGSIVTRKIEGNVTHVLLAGNPARIVKRMVTWKR